MTNSHQRNVPFLDLNATTQEVAEEVHAAWTGLTSTSSFIGGEAVARFEQEWAAFCGTKHAVGVANGTDAIELVLRALEIGSGDEVILPANTFVATAEAVVLAGATPRFVDIDPDTLLVTPDAIADAVNERTSAIIPVHLYGNMPDMAAIGAIAKRGGLAVIEDAAQAHAAGQAGKRAGSFGIAGCFSFYPGKNLGAFGDAGGIVTDDDVLTDRLRSMADHGRSRSHTRHDLLGRNSRLDAIQAAVLSAKLPKLEAWNAARRRVLSIYRDLLPEDTVRLVQSQPESGAHLNVALVRNRDRIREQLAQCGVQTGIHYPVPCHLQAPYANFQKEALPVAESTAHELVSLPLYPQLQDAQIEYVCEQLIGLTQEAAA
jgi:dTDP-4-amino-4,6-dideoxygalactose transaminase